MRNFQENQTNAKASLGALNRAFDEAMAGINKIQHMRPRAVVDEFRLLASTTSRMTAILKQLTAQVEVFEMAQEELAPTKEK
jgi:hypothetical protein